jgi:myo-inositol-1(or 4)-monophosphatase
MPPISPENWDELAVFARKLADAAGDAILPHFRTPAAVDNKAQSGFDPVTIADRGGETAMRQLIEAHFPDHGIIGEEHGVKPSKSGFNWVLDPVDGTRSFIIGVPLWTTLIGLTFEGSPVLGLMNQPFVGERFIGGMGQSFWERGTQRRKLKVNPAKSLSSASLGTVAPEIYKSPAQKNVLDKLTRATRLTRFGGDAYFYCLLASGLIDIAMDAGLETYDIAALVPIIEGAGGIVTTFTGQSATGGGDIIAFSSRNLQEEAMALIRA